MSENTFIHLYDSFKINYLKKIKLHISYNTIKLINCLTVTKYVMPSKYTKKNLKLKSKLL